ncbi:TonB-dependent receptor [Shewanella sp. Isolate11]|uniref:TonB-dependent receptor n=1 Tax=Shewanella sp. Isolate11 TaxID=2908530 RepID=UPI001EFE866B|nr:TonB-dependent receptor [Shewanella sp. Isolate11]MCG9696881.1 TonB-dependent receptor [Shewanella sp. Isolate11]
MNSWSLTAKAVRVGLVAAATSSIAFSGMAFSADEENGEKVERIEVTGSRIKQVDMETSSPVTVLTAADIQMTGEATVADVLNNSSINSFGSWRGTSGYGSGASATSSVQMRGLDAKYTLILLDGRRMPGTSSSSGAAADTSRIPMAIVERIEILREGASAVYGSDAVAGVINIITKKNFEGLNFTYDTELPSIEGGDQNRFNVTTGYSSDKGNITLTYEYVNTQHVMDNEIWKLDDPTYGAYSSYSSVVNGNGASGWVTNSALCNDTENTVDATDGSNNGRCLYSYGEVTKLFGDNVQNSVLSNFNYNLTDDLQFRGRASAALSETDTRYAGTPVSTNLPSMDAGNAYNPVGEDLTLYMRSAPIGERDTRTEINSIDFLGGLVGYTDVGNGLDWEINAQHSRSSTNVWNTNLINDDIVQNLIDSEQYDIFNTTGMSTADYDTMITDFYGQAAHTGTYKAEFTSTQVDGLVSTLLLESGDFSLAGVVGAEFEHVEFVQKSDPQSASGRVSGGSGGDDVDATRDRTSAYVELQASLPFNIDVNAAVRYDEYDQEGDVGAQLVSGKFDSTTPQIGVAWRPVDSLLVRASWGESFRAPNMGEMFSTQALSFETADDNLWCDAGNNAAADPIYCAQGGSQHKTWFGGNPDLKPEEGESFTTGFVWNATDALSFELSYYDLKLENQIASTSLTRLLKDEIDNGGSTAIVRDANGKIDVAYSFDRNMASLETSGLDFKAAYFLETAIGDWTFKTELGYVDEYAQTSAAGEEPFDYAGLQDYPQYRGNVNIGWTQGDWNAAWTTYYIGSQESGNEEFGTDYLADVPSYFKHNVQVSYMHPWNGKLTLGVNNLLDEEAPTWYDGFVDYRDIKTDLYDVLGRTIFFKIEQTF